MIAGRRKTDIRPELLAAYSDEVVDKPENERFEINVDKVVVFDYFRFAFYCALLFVPLYAIVISAIKNDWIMMIIDILLVPVGFVHGLLLLFGVVN